MAIDLPPVMPPQLASQQQIAEASVAGGAVLSARVGGIDMRVLGNTQLDSRQVEAVLQAADSPSQAITELTRRYYNAGHLLVSVRYYRSGNTVTVLISQSQVKGLRGEDSITRHFTGLVGDPDLSLAEFDRARVLADLQARRSGHSYRISYEQHFDDQVILNFHQQPDDQHKATELQAEASNRGSRFLGRYFSSVGLRHQFATGTELTLSYQTAFPEWGEAADGDDYQQGELRVDQPFSFGLYGVELSHIRYRRTPTLAAEGGGLLGLCLPPLISCDPQLRSAELDAEIDRIAITGEQPLYSNPLRRLNFFQHIEYIDSQIRLPGGERLLDESYPTLGLGLRYAARNSPSQRASYLRAEMGVSAGMGSESGSLGSESGNEVSIGKRSAKFIVLQPRLAYRLSLTERWQLTGTVHGQFADDRQLPQQQQFVLGGMDSLGAYLPGVLIGDGGYYANITLSGNRQLWGLQWQPSLFVEYGSSHFNDVAGEMGDAQRLADAGLRLQLSLPLGFETEVLAAAPLYDDVRDDRRRRAMEADFFWRLRWHY